MPSTQDTETQASKAQARAMWALGDYDRVARDVLAPFGRELVDACAIGPAGACSTSPPGPAMSPSPRSRPAPMSSPAT